MSKTEAVNLKDQVIKFYLTAPMDEIDGLQDSLRVIYNHRQESRHSEAIRLGRQRAMQAKEAGEVVPAKKGKGKKANSGETGAFGGKATVDDPLEATA